MESTIDARIYPIGKYKKPLNISDQMIRDGIERIRSLPSRLNTLARSLDTVQLSSGYRDGGWTARQIIHHIADSHTNMYVRIKLALTEDTPVIKPYDQDAWAEIHEAKHGDIEVSLKWIEALHERITATLQSIDERQLERSYYHPEQKKNVSLKEVVLSYAWHGDHHLGQLGVIAETGV